MNRCNIGARIAFGRYITQRLILSDPGTWCVGLERWGLLRHRGRPRHGVDRRARLPPRLNARSQCEPNDHACQNENVRHARHDSVRAIIGVAAIANGVPTSDADDGRWTGRCEEAIDGDTITVKTDRQTVTVEIGEIDSPEIGQPFGIDATRFTV
jgi:hypothetical protein